MTEHRHEWVFDGWEWECFCDCGESLSREEVERRLNNYEEMRDYIIEQVGVEHVPKEWGGELE